MGHACELITAKKELTRGTNPPFYAYGGFKIVRRRRSSAICVEGDGGIYAVANSAAAASPKECTKREC